MSIQPTPAAPSRPGSDSIPQDDNQLMVERREKLKALRDGGGVAFPNDVKPTHRAEALFAQYDSKTREELEPLAVTVSVAGRMMLKRVMGKASFATLQSPSAIGFSSTFA